MQNQTEVKPTRKRAPRMQTGSVPAAPPKKGGFRHNHLGIVVAEEPAKAAKMLADAWTDTGTSENAAQSLGISSSTFWRYVNKLERMGHAAKPRDAHGDPPPRGGVKRTSL